MKTNVQYPFVLTKKIKLNFKCLKIEVLGLSICPKNGSWLGNPILNVPVSKKV
jgi:hypothetical protein